MQFQIFDINDDVLFFVISHLTPVDLLSLSQTCLHFYCLSDPTKYSAMNKYWKTKCQQFWSLTKKNKYTTDNYKNLFQMMASFIIHAHAMNKHADVYLENINSFKTLNLHQGTFGMKMTVDKFVTITKRSCLSYIIEADNLEMFKIFIYNTSEKYINEKLHKFPNLVGSNSILFGVIAFGAIKIARYLLAPVENYKQNDDQIKDSNNYNFANIDIVTFESSLTKHTPLTLAAYYKRVEIVSLLINHPNMTKNGINQGCFRGIVPLHCVCCVSHPSNSNPTEQDAASIAQMLINDERTDVNATDSRGYTPLMYAMQRHKKVFEILINNDKIDVNAQNYHGDTVLHMAATCSPAACIGNQTPDGIVQSVKMLLRRKDFNSFDAKNIDNLTALQVAPDSRFEISPMVAFLKQFNTT